MRECKCLDGVAGIEAEGEAGAHNSAKGGHAQAQLQVSNINLGYTDIKAPIAGKISRTLVTIGNVVGPGSGTLATIVSQDPMYVYFPIAVRTAYELRDRYASKGGANAVIVKLKLPDGRIYARGPRGAFTGGRQRDPTWP